MPPFVMPSFGPLISAEDLMKIHAEPDVKIVDATWIAPFVDPEGEGRFLYEESHIPGAVFFDIDEIADQSSPLPHMLPSPEQFAQQLGALGVGDTDRIVCYDQNRLLASPRAWWMFRAMGCRDVAVLDGGLDAWREAGGGIETGPPSAPVAPQSFAAALKPELVADLDYMTYMVEEHDGPIIDARPAGRFAGLDPEPREGLRGGHMPGAANLPHVHLLRPDGRFRSIEEIAAMFSRYDVSEGRPVATTCGSGVTAAVLALALAMIGRKDVAVYDASWAEWGARDDCPCST